MAQPDFGDNYKNIRYRVTIQDEDGVVRLQDLADKFLFPATPAVKPQCIRVLYSTLTTTYALIGTVAVECSVLQVYNSLTVASTSDIGLSFDGVNDAWRLEGESFICDLLAGKRRLTPGTPIFAKYYATSPYVQPTGGTLRLVLL